MTIMAAMSKAKSEIENRTSRSKHQFSCCYRNERNHSVTQVMHIGKTNRGVQPDHGTAVLSCTARTRGGRRCDM